GIVEYLPPMPVAQGEVIELQVAGGVAGDKVIVGWQVVVNFQAAVGHADAEAGAVRPNLGDPRRRVAQRRFTQHRTGKEDDPAANGNRLGGAQQTNLFGRGCVPGFAVPDAAGQERVVVAGQDVDGHRRRVEDVERPLRGDAVHGEIVEEVAGDEQEVDLSFSRQL